MTSTRKITEIQFAANLLDRMVNGCCDLRSEKKNQLTEQRCQSFCTGYADLIRSSWFCCRCNRGQWIWINLIFKISWTWNSLAITWVKSIHSAFSCTKFIHSFTQMAIKIDYAMKNGKSERALSFRRDYLVFSTFCTQENPQSLISAISHENIPSPHRFAKWKVLNIRLPLTRT